MVDSIITRAKRVAFQGERGAYAQIAAQEALPNVEAVSAPDFEGAIDAVRSGATDLCIIPVENSVYGRIADIHLLLPRMGQSATVHLDLPVFHNDQHRSDNQTANGELFILGEHFLRIRHQLLGLRGATVAGLKTVYSQSPALGQCRRVLHELGVTGHPWTDTAGSARHIAELCDPKAGAIASSLAGELYGLDVLMADVEDEPHNMTRFLIVGREPDDAPNDDSPVITTFIFRVRNVSAALYKAMGGFATNNVNMTKLESYQLGGSFSATQFYADIEGHPDQPNVRRALTELQFFSHDLAILGVYRAHPARSEHRL